MTDIRIIKKYPNRRLYDTSTKTYITLQDVKQLVYDQIDFQVVDANTKLDLTQSTLLQIITEQESSPAALLTTNFLRNLISSYNEESTDKMREYFDTVLAPFNKQQDFIKSQWTNYIDFLQSLTPKTSDKKTRKQ